MRPDLPTRAFRTADGNVNLTLADPANFLLRGSDFRTLTPSCPAIRESNYDPDPAHYDHYQWLASTYTEDGTIIHGVIHNEFHGDEVVGWSARRDFATVQSTRGWSYLARSAEAAFEMNVASGQWQATNLCLISDWGAHPDTSCDPVRRWTAPETGAITVLIRVADVGQGGGNGVDAGVDSPGGVLWSVGIDEGDTATYETMLNLDVSAGHELDFWVDSRGDAGWDATSFEIEIGYGDGICTSSGFQCQAISLTYSVSHDGGATWSSPPAPDHLVATVPVRYVADAGLAAMWQPSGIVQHPTDGYFYMLVQYDFHRDGADVQGECVLRTDTLDDPSSWRAWDGSAFAMELPDPYTHPDLNPADHTCRSVVSAPVYGLTYNSYLERFVAIASYGRPDPEGIYFHHVRGSDPMESADIHHRGGLGFLARQPDAIRGLPHPHRPHEHGAELRHYRAVRIPLLLEVQ